VLDAGQGGDFFLFLNNANNTSNGQYTIQVTEITQQDLTGDTFSTAKAINLGVLNTEKIDTRFDMDTFRINLQAGTAYTADLGIAAPTAGQTLSVNLFNAQGALVVPNLILSGQNFSREFQVQATGDYFIQVNDLNFDSAGDYTFRLNAPLTPAPVPTPTPNPVADPFDIDFVYRNGTEAYASFFDQVEARLKQIIVEGLPSHTLRNGQVIDDLRITVEQRTIDGVFGTLAFAGPDAIRSQAQGGLPAAGTVVIDSADAQSMINAGAFFDVMLHEVMHVLGTGTLWEGRGLSRNGRYTGQNGLEEYRLLTGNSGETFVPATTDNGHWSEFIFGNELLTPSISFSQDVIFSRLSVAALEDLGYTVDYRQADPFVLPVGIRAAEYQFEGSAIA